MKSADANAVASFLKDGGRVVKVKATIPVTEQELLDYLTSRGADAKYQAGDLKPYVHNNKRYSMEGIVRLANEYRDAQQLPPFALRIDSLLGGDEPSQPRVI